MATAERKYIDCRDFPSDKNCSLKISGTEDEVLTAATQHAVTSHGHKEKSRAAHAAEIRAARGMI